MISGDDASEQPRRCDDEGFQRKREPRKGMVTAACGDDTQGSNSQAGDAADCAALESRAVKVRDACCK